MYNTFIKKINLTLFFILTLSMSFIVTNAQTNLNVTLKGTYSLSYGEDIFFGCNSVYISAFNNGIRLLDVSNPVSPIETGFYDNSSYVHTSIKGQYYLYVGDGSKLLILDVSISSSPILISSKDLGGGLISELRLKGNYIFAACDKGVYIIDVSDPENPIEKSVLSHGNAVALNLYVTDNYCYSVFSTYSYNSDPPVLYINNISDPANPVESGSITFPLSRRITVKNNYAYVATNSNFSIYDITNPSSITKVSSYLSLTLPKDLFISGNYAYIADYSGGLKILDISNPASPQKVGSYTSTDIKYAFAVTANQNMVYLVDGVNGLYVLQFDLLPVSVENNVLSENFDGSTFPSSGWTMQHQNDTTWRAGNITDHGFQSIDVTNVYSAVCPWIAEDQDEYIISPTFSLGDGVSTLEFYAGYSTSWLSNAKLKLLISIDNGQNWEKIWECVNDGDAWKWRKIKLGLCSYSNKNNLKLAWEYIGNNGDIVALDNITLTSYYIVTGVEDNKPIVITDFMLQQNYPNPFNPSTVISFQIPNRSYVQLKVYDILGIEIATLVNEERPAGDYKVNFDASSMSSGIYFYRIVADKYIETKKMILLR